jgi:uncharacterized membrane protein YqaE (UPF0057 family)
MDFIIEDRVQLIIKYLDNTTRISIDEIVNDVTYSRITVKEILENILKEDILNKEFIDYLPENNASFYLLNGQLITEESILTDLIKADCINILEVYPSLKGGFDLEDIPIIGAVFRIFGPLIDPIVGIGDSFIFLLQLTVWFGKFIYWFIFFIIWVFSDLLNPIKLIADFWNSIILILVTVINVIIGVFMGISAFVVNQVGQWMQGFWGWDQSSLTKSDKKSNYFKGIDRSKGKKCYLTNNGRVPFSILLGTILCPPIGVFMDMGLTGWMNILICALLTLVFYLPGLFYALLVIYS